MKSTVFSLLIKVSALLQILLCRPVGAVEGRSAFISGEGRFFADQEYSSTFIKNQLKREAFQNVVTKALKDMQLDDRQFWEQYQAKFDKHFTPIKKRLEEAFPVGKEVELKKVIHQRSLLEKNKFAEFMGITGVISSYVIKDMTRSSTDPRSRYLNMEAKVDRGRLNKIYFQLVGGKHYRTVENIYLTSEFHLQGEDWNDVGVPLKTDFTDIVDGHWKKWLDSKLGVPFGGTVIGQGEMESRLVEHLKTSPNILGATQAETGAAPTLDLSKSLWLKISVSINKLHDDTLLKRREFNFAGEILLVDLATNNPVYFEEIKSENIVYSYKNPQELASQVASMVYRLPLVNFSSIGDTIKILPSRIYMRELLIKDFASYETLKRLKDLLNLKGTGLSARAEIESYGQSDATMTLLYEGEPEKFKELFLGLSNQKLGPDLMISIPNNEDFSQILIQNVKQRNDS